MIKRRKKLKQGDVFKIKIKDNIYSYGQIIDKKYNFYVIYDIFSSDKEDLQEVIKKPIIFLVQSVDVALEEGKWKVVGNCNIPEDIKIPYFKMPTLEDDWILINYKNEILRKATKEEEEKLDELFSFSPALVEAAIKAKYGIEEWYEDFDSIIYKGDK